MAPATIKKLQDDELKLLTNFVNLLDRALELDPAKRLTPKEALNVSACRVVEDLLRLFGRLTFSTLPFIA